MRKEFCNIPDFRSVVPMNCRVLVNKALHEIISEDFSYFTESLAQQSEKSQVGSLLLTAVDDHVADFILMA